MYLRTVEWLLEFPVASHNGDEGRARKICLHWASPDVMWTDRRISMGNPTTSSTIKLHVDSVNSYPCGAEQNQPFQQWNFPPPTNMYVFPILYSSSAPEFLIPSGFLQSHIFPSCAMESTCFSFLFLSLATREITSSHNRICKGKKGKFQLTLEKNCARKLLKKRAWPKMFLKAWILGA